MTQRVDREKGLTLTGSGNTSRREGTSCLDSNAVIVLAVAIWHERSQNQVIMH